MTVRALKKLLKLGLIQKRGNEKIRNKSVMNNEKGAKIKDFEIVDLLPLHRQMTLVIFQNPDTQKCEVQILPVSLKTTELKTLQEMQRIPAEPGANAATFSVEIEKSLSHEILDWCSTRSITPEQLTRAFIYFCGEPENTDILRAWIRQEIAQSKIEIS